MATTTLTTLFPITVNYWHGTMQLTGKAQTVRGAMRIAARNKNAYGPTFYAANGSELVPIFAADGEFMGLGDPGQPEVCFA